LPDSFFIRTGAGLVDAGLLGDGEVAAADVVAVGVCFAFDPPELQALTVTRKARAPAAQATLRPVCTVSP
jgi:hypothetical protein